jgi:hypothetical protein
LAFLFFSLSFPQLDGVPVVSEVQTFTSTSFKTIDYRSSGKHEGDCWPVISSFPTHVEDKAVNKMLCVPQLIGLLQFSKIPRHPIKRCRIKAVKWGIHKGKWRTTLVKKNIDILRGKVTIHNC